MQELHIFKYLKIHCTDWEVSPFKIYGGVLTNSC